MKKSKPWFLLRYSVTVNYLRKLFKTELCPTCKTGEELLKLDPKEPICPNLYLHTEEDCGYYVSNKSKI